MVAIQITDDVIQLFIPEAKNNCFPLNLRRHRQGTEHSSSEQQAAKMPFLMGEQVLPTFSL